MRRYNRFLLRYLLGLAIFSLPVWISLVFIIRVGENQNIDQVVSQQLENGAVFGTMTSFNPFSYKLEMLRRLRPEFIVLGSSRTFCFRGEYLGPRFYNCSLALNFLSEGELFLAELFKQEHKPKLILLALDHWMFNAKFADPVNYAYHETKGDEITFDKMVAPFKQLGEGLLSPAQFLGTAVFGQPRSRLINYPILGLMALVRGMGFRADGSYLSYPLEMSGQLPFRDARFKRSFELMEQGGERFEHASELDPERVRRLEHMIAQCREAGVELVLFLPPFARPVYDKMIQSGNYGILQKLREYARALPLKSFDFTDPDTLGGGGECEFIDGFHGGDVSAMRMLRAMSRAGALRDYVDEAKISELIEKYKGHALAKFEPDLYNFEEIDFLKIGCVKTP